MQKEEGTQLQDKEMIPAATFSSVIRLRSKWEAGNPDELERAVKDMLRYAWYWPCNYCDAWMLRPSQLYLCDYECPECGARASPVGYYPPPKEVT